MRQILWVLGSVFLLWLAFPPADLGFLVFVAPAPFLWAMRRTRSAREAGWLGFLFAGLFFGVLLWWLTGAGLAAWLSVVVVMAVWGTAFGLVLFAARQWSPWRWWGVAVGGWALWEFVRVHFPFGGLPWGSLGHPIGTLAWSRGSAQWIGTSGWAVLVAGGAAGIVLMLDEEADRRPLELIVAAVIAFTLLGAVFVPDARGGAVRTAVVQGNSPCPGERCEGEHRQIFESHMRLTTLVEPGSVDLLVWGEDAFGGEVNPTFDGDVRRDMGGQAALIDAYLIAGGTRPAQPGHYEKYAVVFDSGGDVAGTYLKRHPVPFGEYVPFRRLLQFVPHVAEEVDDMVRGTEPGVFPLVVGDSEGMVGTVLSIEAGYARLMRDTVGEGAQLVVVLANTASFGRGAASDQLIGMVRMSAAALGVDVVVASITGRSTVVRADGSVGRGTALFEEDLLRGVVNLQLSRRTVFAVAGDWLQILAMVAGAIVFGTTIGGPSREFKIRPEHRR
jgi:apolipoprotein N-acyltransferase